MRTAAEWQAKLAARRARLEAEKRPWLRELFVRLVVAAEAQLVRARQSV